MEIAVVGVEVVDAAHLGEVVEAEAHPEVGEVAVRKVAQRQ